MAGVVFPNLSHFIVACTLIIYLLYKDVFMSTYYKICAVWSNPTIHLLSTMIHFCIL